MATQSARERSGREGDSVAGYGRRRGDLRPRPHAAPHVEHASDQCRPSSTRVWPAVPLPGQSLLMLVLRRLRRDPALDGPARAAARTARGWPIDDVQRAAELAAERLRGAGPPVRAGPARLPPARPGGLLVLATTTPHDLVAPLARRLDIDHVIATRYGRYRDGAAVERFNGKIDGGFVWSCGKLQAVRRWARTAAIDLRDSWAYSDSIYDIPLLDGGRPTHRGEPGLPAARRGHLAPLADRSPRQPRRSSEAARNRAHGRGALAVTAGGAAVRALRHGRHRNIPRRGPAIVAANHRSYFDPVAYGLAMFEAAATRGAWPRRSCLTPPSSAPCVRASGAICVDRSRAGPAAFEEAEQALRSGELLLIAPQGTIPQGQDFFDPRLKGKSGAARLAAATGAPVIPLGVWGSERVWPRSSRLPNLTNVLHPPTVRVRVGPPVPGLTGTTSGRHRTDHGGHYRPPPRRGPIAPNPIR